MNTQDEMLILETNALNVLGYQLIVLERNIDIIRDERHSVIMASLLLLIPVKNDTIEILESLEKNIDYLTLCFEYKARCNVDLQKCIREYKSMVLSIIGVTSINQSAYTFLSTEIS